MAAENAVNGAAIARELGHPVTTTPNGTPLLHRPVYASELTSITSLDASELRLKTLDGFQDLPNLRQLDLTDNQLGTVQIDLPADSDFIQNLSASGIDRSGSRATVAPGFLR